ncbi:MAG: hypothetical protein UW31_C0002G0087, partial [Candidatus Collierbacteria bacterium GW2011_GWA2_44_13]
MKISFPGEGSITVFRPEELKRIKAGGPHDKYEETMYQHMLAIMSSYPGRWTTDLVGFIESVSFDLQRDYDFRKGLVSEINPARLPSYLEVKNFHHFLECAVEVLTTLGWPVKIEKAGGKIY